MPEPVAIGRYNIAPPIVAGDWLVVEGVHRQGEVELPRDLHLTPDSTGVDWVFAPTKLRTIHFHRASEPAAPITVPEPGLEISLIAGAILISRFHGQHKRSRRHAKRQTDRQRDRASREE